MARPTPTDISSGVGGWDATVNDNFDIVFEEPFAIHDHTGDQTDLAATFPAASYENCLVWVDHTVDGWTLYHSDGSTWESFLVRFGSGAFISLSDTPSSYSGEGGKLVAVASGETALEFVQGPIESMIIAVTDEGTAIDTTGTKLTFRMPYAFVLTEVRASVNSACSTGTLTVDINEGGVSILSTKLTIDATEETSTTAAAAAVISDASLADDAEITIDVDNTGDDTATGLKVVLIGRQA